MKQHVFSSTDDVRINKHDTSIARLLALCSIGLRDEVVDEVVDAIGDIMKRDFAKLHEHQHEEELIKWDSSETACKTSLSREDVRLRAHARSAAAGRIRGNADAIQNRAVGLFPYRGGPKGFERGSVGVVTVDSMFTRERCCGMIGKGNGYGMFDRFCTKKNCTVKSHGAVKFHPVTQYYYAPASNDSAYCCFFVHVVAAHQSLQTIQLNSHKWIEKMERIVPDVRGSILAAAQLVSRPCSISLLTMNKETSSARTIDSILKYIHDRKRRGTSNETLVLTRSREETHTLISNLHLYKLSHYVIPKKGVVGFVSVCEYSDLCRAEHRYDAVIVSSVSSLTCHVEADLRNGSRQNVETLCKVLKAENVNAVMRVIKM
jgi:hypothetical protein